MANWYVNVLVGRGLSTDLVIIYQHFLFLFEALFLTAGSFNGFVVGLDDVGFVDNTGKPHIFAIFNDGNADANEFLNNFKAGVEVCFFRENMLGHLGKVAGSLVAAGFEGIPRAGEGDGAEEFLAGIGDVKVGLGVGSQGFFEGGQISFRSDGVVFAFHHLANAAALKDEDFASGVDVDAGGLHLVEEK